MRNKLGQFMGIPVEKRFWDKASIGKPKDCWIWRGAKFGNGYGAIQVDGTPELAHRVAWLLTRGEIPEGLCVLHECDNPICINPEHLFLGTQLDNIADRTNKGRSASGSRNGNAKLSDADVQLIHTLYKPRDFSQRKLARIFGVNQSTIRRILVGETWRHLSPRLLGR